MNHLVSSLSLIFLRKDSRLVIIFSTAVFLLLLLLVQNGEAARSAFSFDVLPLSERLSLFFSTFFNIRNTFTAGTLILAILGSLLGGINIALAYIYVRLRGETILRSGLYSGIGLFFAFLGIGCAACGTAFLSVILSLFGFSAMLARLPYQGMEIGYIGLIILIMATYTLSSKVSAPNVC
ncbi:MAG: hypothetical protein RIQ41_425 [Candidatus Parcubacteria bacterium]|jgi:hypothetical protein